MRPAAASTVSVASRWSIGSSIAPARPCCSTTSRRSTPTTTAATSTSDRTDSSTCRWATQAPTHAVVRRNDAAQDLTLLNGKILRITTDGMPAPGNPITGGNSARCATRGNTPSTPNTPCQELFAWGLRNPYRFAFDRNDGSNRFFINDVGQSTREEVDPGTSAPTTAGPSGRASAPAARTRRARGPTRRTASPSRSPTTRVTSAPCSPPAPSCPMGCGRPSTTAPTSSPTPVPARCGSGR